MNVIRREGNIIMAEVDGKFHVVSYSESANQVYSILPMDSPGEDSGCSQYMARASGAGVKYVSSPHSRQNANRHFRNAIRRVNDDPFSG